MADHPHRGSTLDLFLEGEGVAVEFEAQAIKEVLAWQLAEAMNAQKVSRRGMAAKMGTSRTQVDRVLDPTNGAVTLDALQRAAAVVGRKVQLQLV